MLNASAAKSETLSQGRKVQPGNRRARERRHKARVAAGLLPGGGVAFSPQRRRLSLPRDCSGCADAETVSAGPDRAVSMLRPWRGTACGGCRRGRVAAIGGFADVSADCDPCEHLHSRGGRSARYDVRDCLASITN